VALPALVGTSTDAAQGALQAAGFIPNVIAQGSGSSTVGTVTAQQPPAGTVARPGTVVTLSVTGGG
jgi:beta-lactam-binding protein with PASTA domain